MVLELGQPVAVIAASSLSGQAAKQLQQSHGRAKAKGYQGQCEEGKSIAEGNDDDIANGRRR